MGYLKKYSNYYGDDFHIECPAMRWNGSSWVRARVYRWSGSAWVLIQGDIISASTDCRFPVSRTYPAVYSKLYNTTYIDENVGAKCEYDGYNESNRTVGVLIPHSTSPTFTNIKNEFASYPIGHYLYGTIGIDSDIDPYYDPRLTIYLVTSDSKGSDIKTKLSTIKVSPESSLHYFVQNTNTSHYPAQKIFEAVKSSRLPFGLLGELSFINSTAIQSVRMSGPYLTITGEK